MRHLVLQPARLATLMLATVALLVALPLGGCTRTQERPSLPAPAESVQQLLELRSRNVTSTADYLRHVESTQLAQALASDSGKRRAGEKPTPAWSEPKISRQESRSADVKVVWKKSEKFEAWPSATLFRLRLIEGRWLVIDAVDATATAK